MNHDQELQNMLTKFIPDSTWIAKYQLTVIKRQEIRDGNHPEFGTAICCLFLFPYQGSAK